MKQNRFKVYLKILFMNLFVHILLNIQCDDGQSVFDVNKIFNEALSENDIDQKIKLYTQIIDHQNDFYRAYYNRGIAYMKSKQYQCAELDFTIFKKMKQGDANVHHYLALSQYQLGKYQKALKNFRKAFKLNPLKKESLRNIIRSHIALKNYDKALDLLHSEIKKAPADELYQLRAYVYECKNEFYKAVDDYIKVLENKANDLQLIYKLGVLNFKIKNYIASEFYFEQLLNPIYNSKVLLYLSKIDFYNQKYNESLRYLNRLLDHQPDNYEALKLGYLIHLKQKKYSDSLIHLEKILKNNPDDYHALYNKGLLYMEMKEYEKAIDVFESSLKLHPDQKKIYMSLYVIYKNMNDDQKAVNSVDMILAIDPHDQSALMLKISYLMNYKKIKEAQNLVDQLIEIDPKKDQFVFLKGSLYEMIKDFEKALYYYNQCIKLNSFHIEALKRRAALYYHQKQYEQSRSDYKRLIELKVSDSEIYLRKAIVEFNLGLYDESKKSYEKARQLGRNLSEYEYYFSEFQQGGMHS